MDMNALGDALPTVSMPGRVVGVSHKETQEEKKPIEKKPTTMNGRKLLSVAASSPVKQVAGSIAHTARETEPPMVSAVGPASVNQAVKSIAIARDFLRNDKLDLFVTVERSSERGEIKDLIIFTLEKRPLQTADPEVEYQNLKSSGKSSAGQLAGAVAKHGREGHHVTITSVGQNPVFRAIDSLVYARRYLKDDKMDIEFRPEFTHVKFDNGNEANAMQLVVSFVNVDAGSS